LQTHPLTDDICERIADTEDRPFTSIEKDNMRAAYDKGREDQLNECLDWLDKQDEHLFGYRDLMWKGLRGPKEPVPLRLQISDCFHSEDWKLMSKLANQLHKIEQQEDN
tara:strand:- start:392 stop:718 length:327 start_codon:yes stop_codon:yes gene_type:complete